MFAMTLNAAEKIVRAKVTLNREQPFFAYILFNFNEQQVKDDSEIPTMAVNQYGRLYFNENFTNDLSGEELSYVLCHEALHIAKGDHFRRGSRDPSLWNVASDCIINDMLNQEGFVPPVHIVDDEENKFKKGEFKGLIPTSDGNIKLGEKTYNTRGKTTEELYDEMVENQTQLKVFLQESCGGGGDGKGNRNAAHGGFDVHLDDDSDENGGETGEKESAGSAGAAENGWRKVVIEAATTAQQRGKMPGCANGIIDGILDPRVDWRSRLRSFITNELPVDFETRLPGRKFYATGAWCPRFYKENVNLFVSIDCSGSTLNDRERFASEIQSIVTSHTQLKARLIFWSHGEISDDNDIEITTQTVEKMKSLDLTNINGGTELSAYTRHLNKKKYTSRIHIVLTDGYIENKPEVPSGQILFVLCGSSTDEIVKQYGECIKIED
jgi:predicted metal-dependent peptidase